MFLYGRAGRLTAKNDGFRPGQVPPALARDPRRAHHRPDLPLQHYQRVRLELVGCAAAGHVVQVRGRDPGEEDAKLAQKLGQLQLFLAVFTQEYLGQLVSFGPT